MTRSVLTNSAPAPATYYNVGGAVYKALADVTYGDLDSDTDYNATVVDGNKGYYKLTENGQADKYLKANADASLA